MPKVSIYEGADHPGERRTRCTVGWAKGYDVQIGVTRLAEGAEPTDEFLTVDPEAVPFAAGGLVTGPGEPGGDQVPAQIVADDGLKFAWQGQHMHLSRGQINDLIRVLREARDAAYGKDE